MQRVIEDGLIYDKEKVNREYSCNLRLIFYPRREDDIIEDNIDRECLITLSMFKGV